MIITIIFILFTLFVLGGIFGIAFLIFRVFRKSIEKKTPEFFKSEKIEMEQKVAILKKDIQDWNKFPPLSEVFCICCAKSPDFVPVPICHKQYK